MNLQLAIWLPYWRFWKFYHRYTVEGLEQLDGPQAKLIAGYHGRGLAIDMCILNIAIYDRLHYMPHSLMHRAGALVPFWRWMWDGLGFFVIDGPALAAAVKRGEHLIVTPGGALEACRRWDDSYRVDWGNHTGYVRLAVKYQLPIVPVAAAGADGTYIGLNDGPAFGSRIGIPKDWAYLAWLGLGPLGPYPWSPPFPVRFHQIVGTPIDPRDDGVTSQRDREGLLRVHRRVTASVQTLIDRARERVRNKEV
jgi:1-acyl-sn-glycerol-3-phosphate acyltransferase